jgi:hypothetical protein
MQTARLGLQDAQDRRLIAGASPGKNESNAKNQ